MNWEKIKKKLEIKRHVLYPFRNVTPKILLFPLKIIYIPQFRKTTLKFMLKKNCRLKSIIFKRFVGMHNAYVIAHSQDLNLKGAVVNCLWHWKKTRLILKKTTIQKSEFMCCKSRDQAIIFILFRSPDKFYSVSISPDCH